MPLSELLRMRNLFGNDEEIQDNPYLSSRNLFDPREDYETPAMNSFLESVLNPPERQRPSIKRMIGTGLLSALQGSTDSASEKKGFWGSLGNKPFNIDQTAQILNAPFEQKLSDWKTRTGALEKAANIESQLPARRAQAYQRMAQANVIPQRESRLANEGITRANQGQQKINIQADRADIERKKLALNEWKAKNPNGRVIPLKGGNVIVVNPVTGEAQDTGISSGMLSDEDRIKLMGSQRIDQINTQGEIRKDLQNLGHQQDLSEIAARGEESRKTKTTIPGKASNSTSSSDKPLAPTQQKVQLQLKANQAIQEHPEWSEFISVNPNSGMVEIEAPRKTWYGGTSGPDQDTYNQMVSYISGKSQASPGNTPVDRTAPKAAPKPTTDTSKVIVQDKNGKKYRLPASQLKEAIAQGYTQVK